MMRALTENEIRTVINAHPLGLKLISFHGTKGRRRVVVEHEQCGERFDAPFDSFRSGGAGPKRVRCPKCHTGSVAEAFCVSAVAWLLNSNAERQARVVDVVPSAQVAASWRYDGYLPDHKLVIEHHGAQHYDPDHGYWRKPGGYESARARDRLKEQIGLKAGLRYVVVPDLWNTAATWAEAVIEALDVTWPGWDADAEVSSRRTRFLSGGIPDDMVVLLTARSARLPEIAMSRGHTVVSMDAGQSKATFACSLTGHANWEATYNNYIFGTGCPECAIEQRAARRRMDYADVVERAAKHGWAPSFPEEKYQNQLTLMPWLCLDCGQSATRLFSFRSIARVTHCCRAPAREPSKKQQAVERLAELPHPKREAELAALAAEAGTCEAALRRKARENGLVPPGNTHARWTQEEDTALRKHWPRMTDLCRFLSAHTEGAIVQRAAMLGLESRGGGRPRSTRPFTPADHDLLRSLEGRGLAQIAREMKRPRHDVDREMRRLGLDASKRPNSWCQSQLTIVEREAKHGAARIREALVEAGYPERSNKAICHQMDILRSSGKAVYSGKSTRNRGRSEMVSSVAPASSAKS